MQIGRLKRVENLRELWQIEAAFGGPLDWQRLDNRNACRIQYVIPGRLKDREHWPELQDRLIAAMVRLERAFKPEIQRLK